MSRSAQLLLRSLNGGNHRVSHNHLALNMQCATNALYSSNNLVFGTSPSAVSSVISAFRHSREARLGELRMLDKVAEAVAIVEATVI